MWTEIPGKCIIRNTNATESYYWYLIDQVYVAHCLVYINLIDIS